MAMIITSQVLYDGPRNVVMQFTGVNDGSGGGDSPVSKVDVSALNPPAKSVKVKKITYDVSGGVLVMSWDADSPVPFLNVSDFNMIDYSLMGGLTNGGGDTANGNIVLTPLGFDAGATYTVTMEMVKKNKL